MNDEDKKLLELYIKESRKKKIIIFIAIIFFLLFFMIFVVKYYIKNLPTEYSSNNNINVQKENQNLLNEVVENNINIVSNENTKEENKTEEIPNDKIITNAKEESTNQETKVEAKENISTSNEKDNNKSKDTNDKPKNKDFLFINGYTMDNVTQAAQDYLKSYNYSGECVPIKDDEGVYLGMRVIFY